MNRTSGEIPRNYNNTCRSTTIPPRRLSKLLHHPHCSKLRFCHSLSWPSVPILHAEHVNTEYFESILHECCCTGMVHTSTVPSYRTFSLPPCCHCAPGMNERVSCSIPVVQSSLTGDWDSTRCVFVHVGGHWLCDDGSDGINQSYWCLSFSGLLVARFQLHCRLATSCRSLLLLLKQWC